VLPGGAGTPLRSSDRLQHGPTFGAEEPPENPPAASSRRFCHRRLLSTAQSIVAGAPPGANHAVARASDHHRSVQLRDIQADPDSGRLGDVDGRDAEGREVEGPEGDDEHGQQANSSPVTTSPGSWAPTSPRATQREGSYRGRLRRGLCRHLHTSYPHLYFGRTPPCVWSSPPRAAPEHTEDRHDVAPAIAERSEGNKYSLALATRSRAVGRVIGATTQPCEPLEYAEVSFSTLVWSGVGSRGRAGPSWLSTSSLLGGRPAVDVLMTRPKTSSTASMPTSTSNDTYL